MSQTRKVLNFDEREFVLVGTAHVSKESIEEVKNVIAETQPDCVAIELDEQRYKSLNDKEGWRNLDIIKVLRNHQGFLLLANLVLASFQKRMGLNVGVQPGDEMRVAVDAAGEAGIPVEMVDRPIQTTLRRAWGRNSVWGKCNLLATLIASALDKEEVSSEQIESLKNANEMDSMMAALAEYLPAVKEVLIDERDKYLACHIWNCKGNKITAVLGAGHLPGVMRHLEALSKGEEDSDTSEIEKLPSKNIFGKIIGWLIPVLIILFIAAGFYFGGKSKGADLVGQWILWNSVLAGLGTVVAGGHIVSVIVGIVGAPLTSLCPVVGVGMFTGIIQAVVRKPKVKDLECIQDDVTSVRGFYRNRILRVLLVFILSSLGSSIGTIIAGAAFVGEGASFIQRIIAG